MSIFRRKQKGMLGVDFGAGGIKVIQIEESNGRGRLITYGYAEREFEAIGGDYLASPDETAALLKAICAKARVTATGGVAALPIPAVFSAVLSIAEVPRKELPEAIKWEAKKLIPLPLEEVVLNFRELSAESASGTRPETAKPKRGAIEVLLTAAPKSIIEKYLEVARKAGLELTSLETEAFALIRALLGGDLLPTAIVDMGAVRSNVIIVDRGVPMLTRSIEVGGKKCTEAIAARFGVDSARAEAMKRELGASGVGAGAGIPDIVREVLEPLFNEMKYSFNVYRTRTMIARPPEQIVLTGGGSGLPSLADAFAQEFNLRTRIGSPWERITFHSDLEPILQSLGSRFAVALGLALRNL